MVSLYVYMLLIWTFYYRISFATPKKFHNFLSIYLQVMLTKRLIILVMLSFKSIRRGYDSLEFIGGGAGSFLSYVFICLLSYDLNVRFSVCYKIFD